MGRVGTDFSVYNGLHMHAIVEFRNWVFGCGAMAAEIDRKNLCRQGAVLLIKIGLGLEVDFFFDGICFFVNGFVVASHHDFSQQAHHYEDDANHHQHGHNHR